MQSEPTTTPAPASRPRRNYRKVMLILLAAALITIVIADWDEFKAGFADGYRDAATR